MERAAVSASAAGRPAFRDGLGERRHIVDPAGNEALEQLCLRSELAAVPSFEFALRERISRLATFRHEHFARIRSVERLSDRESTLAIVSERAAGIRLSELLLAAEQRRLGLDITAALHLIKQLVPAVATLHESAREVAHGALGPERLIIAPDGRLIVTEYALGAALEQLRYPRERYWSELRVALPSSAGLPRFDQRADVTQVGVVALSLILGRPMRDDEFPTRIADVVASTWAVSPKGGFEPLPAGLRSWLSRALQLDVRTGFLSAIEARAELDKVLADVGDYIASPESFEAFLARYNGAAAPAPRPPLASVQPPTMEPRPAATAAPPPQHAVPNVTPPRGTPMPLGAHDATPPLGIPIPAALRGQTIPRQSPSTPPRGTPPASAQSLTPPLGTRIPAVTPPYGTPGLTPRPVSQNIPPVQDLPPVVPPPPVQIQSMAESVAALVSTPARGTPIPAAARRATVPASRSVEPAFLPMAEEEAEQPARNWPKLAAMAGVLVALLLLGGVAAWWFLRPEPVVVTDGTLVITTNPNGAQVMVDGRPRGATPLTLQLSEGAHRLELRSAGGSRAIPVQIVAGTQLAQFIELPQAPSGVGHLQIRTEPAGARVTVDGVARGTSPLTVPQLQPGEHAVVLESELGAVKQTVTIESGITAQLVVPLTAPEGAPVSGWIAVSSPIELQLFEGDRLLGTSRSDRVMVAAGRHELDLVNETFGYHTSRSIQVAAGKVASIAAEMPNGMIAINAAPWAEVTIDGVKVGETPIGNHQLPIGLHQVVFRHPELGEQVHTATVTLKEVARLSVNMRRP
jgi:hypothetical protein